MFFRLPLIITDDVPYDHPPRVRLGAFVSLVWRRGVVLEHRGLDKRDALAAVADRALDAQFGLLFRKRIFLRDAKQQVFVKIASVVPSGIMDCSNQT
jgi:hypothetical protein